MHQYIRKVLCNLYRNSIILCLYIQPVRFMFNNYNNKETAAFTTRNILYILFAEATLLILAISDMKENMVISDYDVLNLHTIL